MVGERGREIKEDDSPFQSQPASTIACSANKNSRRKNQKKKKKLIQVLELLPR